MLVFLTNKGEMTAVSGAGSYLWQEYVQVGTMPPGAHGEGGRHRSSRAEASVAGNE